jgi:putative transcriptional regulator
MIMYVFKSKPISQTHYIKTGSVLIAQKVWNDELFNRSVILILEHNENGSRGVILNKFNLISETMSLITNKKLQYGGSYDTDRVGFLHSIKNLPKAIKLSEGVYFSESYLEIEEAVSIDPSNLSKIRAFIGFTIWEKGELEKEITEKKWWINDFKLEDLYQVDGEELWGYKLLRAGNIYGLFYDVPDPCLN